MAEAPVISSLQDIVGFHIRLAHGAVNRHFTETFCDLGMTQKQVSVLWLVSDNPGLSQIELGRELQMDRATTMTIVNRMQQRNFLRRERSATDGRKQSLFLTDEGAKALALSKSAVAQHEEWLRSRLNPEEIKKLVEMLAKIHD
ncbi:MarR family winged helix-turn-helix transcriptional regulator [Altericroceibacterium endophyticum]|uniref:MarR family winged helix-turn-helix transcriptional regulator n=1 Tax=Altericroceibacterium endophyticum TaxID=1808508 RepID=UPI0019255B04|nr:MarR family transcriptional regulator [Altericroceibacterium endophyticum]